MTRCSFEGSLKMTMIEKVARAICSAEGHRDSYYVYLRAAKAAIEAMRSLVQMTPNGNAADHYALQKYIDAVLKEGK